VKIAILGGTGKEGSGLAARWARAGHTIVIGSRDAERARGKAEEMRRATGKSAISGASNADAATEGEVIVIALPPDGLSATLPGLAAACTGKVVISTVVSLTFGGGRLFNPPAAGSSAEEALALLPGAKLAASFHHIAAHELSETEHAIECDLLMCGDADGKKVAAELGASMGLRAIDVGAITNAGPLEGITAVLATINRRHKIKNAGIRITGV
jgi:NADPH-dependent F420 reductase